MIGRRFGSLTVVEKGERRDGKRQYWICVCDCGNKKAVAEHHLKSGHTRSCGCYRRKVQMGKAVDLKGQRFGRLVALQPVRDENGYLKGWECVCDCGKRCVCPPGNLRSGITRSCGCLKEETRKENMEKAIHFVEGTCVERIASRKPFANNTTGHRGVYRRQNGRWRASIGFCGKVYLLGTFEKFDDAVAARLDAEKRLYDPLLERYGKGRTEKSGDKFSEVTGEDD